MSVDALEERVTVAGWRPDMTHLKCNLNITGKLGKIYP